MLIRILVGVIAAPLFLAAIVGLPSIWVAALLAVMSAVASGELLRATGAAPHFGIHLLTGAAAACVPFAILWERDVLMLSLIAWILLGSLFLVAIISYEKEKSFTAEGVLYCVLGGLVIPVFLSSLLRLRIMANGQFAVLLPIGATFAADTGAYFTGVFFGRHKGIIKVSPHKSAEGFVGGLAWSIGILLLYGLAVRSWFSVPVSFPRLALYGFVGGFAAELGDLAFSLIKRQFGVKDYGRLLPGHGGMLDRFDSMCFAAPAIWILMTVLPAM